MLCCWSISVWKHALGENLMIKNKLNDKHLDDLQHQMVSSRRGRCTRESEENV